MSVCLSHLSTAACRCGGFAAVGPAGRRHLSIAAVAGRRGSKPAAQHRGFQQQMRAVSRCQLTHEAEHRLVVHVLSETLAARFQCTLLVYGWLGSRVVSLLDSGAEGPGFKSQPRRCRVAVLGKLFTPIVPLFTRSEIGSSPLKVCGDSCRPGGK